MGYTVHRVAKESDMTEDVLIPISQLLPPSLPLGIHAFVLYVCVSVSAMQIGSSVPPF